MKRGKSKRLVIDASVGRAAGPENAVHPTSKNCRDVLLAVLEICHQAVFSPSLADEWREHASAFAVTWRRSMFAKKKIVRVSAAEDTFLRSRAEAMLDNQFRREALRKDMHLVETALAADARILSLDESARELVALVAERLIELQRICWVNPDSSDEKPLDWLHAGAPDDKTRRFRGGTDVD